MSKKVWTWKEACSLGLLYDKEKINLSRLYPENIPFIYKSDITLTWALKGVEMKGEFCLDDGEIKYIMKIPFDGYLTSESANNIGRYIGRYVLSATGIPISAFCKYAEHRHISEKQMGLYCIFTISILEWSEDIIVKFENNDKDVYLEYPMRKLYTIP